MNLLYHIKKIAVATDFSEAASNAVAVAFQLAKMFEAEIAIIHAVSPTDSRNKKAEFVSSAYTRLKEIQQSKASDFEAGIEVNARVGEVDEYLYSYCLKNKTDLLILGLKPGDRKIFGSSRAYEIIMKVECPVLSIPISIQTLQFNNILFPVRDVTGVKEKLLYSLPYMRKMNAVLRMMIFGFPSAQQIVQVKEVAAKEDIIFDPPDWDKLKDRDIPGQILDCADKVEADLIVINATSEKEWYKILGENYTETLLRESGLPLLSITHQFESHRINQPNASGGFYGE